MYPFDSLLSLRKQLRVPFDYEWSVLLVRLTGNASQNPVVKPDSWTKFLRCVLATTENGTQARVEGVTYFRT